MMKIAEMETFLTENPKVKQVPGNPHFGDSYRQGLKKPSEGFRDILREMKRKNRSAFTPPSINTW